MMGDNEVPENCPDCSNETQIPLSGGFMLCCESADQNEMGTSYIRGIDRHGKEIVYWNSDEWKESPEFVMGAIMGFIKGDNRND